MIYLASVKHRALTASAGETYLCERRVMRDPGSTGTQRRDRQYADKRELRANIEIMEWLARMIGVYRRLRRSGVSVVERVKGIEPSS